MSSKVYKRLPFNTQSLSCWALSPCIHIAGHLQKINQAFSICRNTSEEIFNTSLEYYKRGINYTIIQNISPETNRQHSLTPDLYDS